MRFEDFARGHGLIIDHLIPHKWVATPTEDHPRKRNGRYKFLGDVGWVQNWATMQRPEIWRSDKPIDHKAIYRAKVQESKDREMLAKKAASKAAFILHNSVQSTHPYLEAKGFPDQQANVWTAESGERLLVVPMRCNGKLVGLQLINDKGEKKFLHGQRTKGAVFTIDAHGIPIFCEGFATALSIQAVMRLVKVRYSIYVCFSAGNMEFVAGSVIGGFVVADNDVSRTGENSAIKAGKPYWISPTTGQDFNDYHRSVGSFQAANSLKKFLIENKTLISVSGT